MQLQPIEQPINMVEIGEKGVGEVTCWSDRVTDEASNDDHSCLLKEEGASAFETPCNSL